MKLSRRQSDRAVMNSIGSKPITAHDDTKEFIRGLEMTARKVLTNANKKRMQELRRQQSLARRLGAKSDADPPKKYVIEVPPEDEEWGDQLASKTMEITSTGMVVGVRATRRPSRPPPFDSAEVSGGSFPPLDKIVTDATSGGDTEGRAGTASRQLPRIIRRDGGLTLSTPKVGQARGEVGDGGRDEVAAAGPRKAATAGVPAAKIDGRLTVSPLFSASMMGLTKPPKIATDQDDDPLSGTGGGGGDEEEGRGIANMRVVNASKVIGKHSGTGPNSSTRKRKGNRGAAETEGKGVTSWSSDDLRVKYRAEREREEAYQAFRLEEQVAEALEQDYGQVVAVPEVDRHPLYVAYYTQLERENTRCLLRASARNKMKRFITDVHTVWLTNLAHHPEFRSMVRGVAMSHQDGGDGHRDSNESGGCDAFDQSAGATPETTSRRGLDGGRDSAAIAASESQIQSVQPERAFRRAFFYASTSQGTPPQTSHLTTVDPSFESERRHNDQAAGTSDTMTPLAAHNALSYDDADKIEGGAPPELPPPPRTAPTLAILVSERRRVMAISTVGDGRSRKSLGGGGSGGARRRSVAGGGGDAGSWLDTSTRVLRVLRFAHKPPPGPPSTEDEAVDDARDTAHIDSTSGVSGMTAGTASRTTAGGGKKGESAPPTSISAGLDGARWMISSFHPYDGSETRVVIPDATVNKVVGEVLSASGPLTLAGSSGLSAGPAGTAPAMSITKGAGVEAGGPARDAAPIATRAAGMTFGGKQGEEGGGRLLVLRRGVRVPVLGKDGNAIGKVLSVVEVFVSSCTPTPPGSTGTHGSSSASLEAARGRDRAGGSSSGEEDAAGIAAIAADNVLLEVTAYPAGKFSALAEEGVRDSLAERLRREGRRRVVLTAESLWQRRRLLHPSTVLSSGRPPTGGTKSWLLRHPRGEGGVGGTPPDARVRQGGQRASRSRSGEDGPGIEILGVRHVGKGGGIATEEQGAVEDSGKGSDSDDGRARGEVESLPRQALDDLLDMVAFGHPDDDEEQDQGLFSTKMPLLLRPAQRFGSEPPRQPAALTSTPTPAQKSVATGPKALDSSVAQVVRRGVASALLAEESRAEVLLSLVRVGRSPDGRGRNASTSVDGIDSSSITPDDSEQSLVEAWEEEADRVEPLSMRVSGRRGHAREVPGTCSFGQMGVTFSYPQASERTRAVASFFRDASKSSSDSIMVVVALALDTPRLSPLVVAWEREPFEPEAAPDEDVLGIVPGVMIQPGAVLQEGVVSDLGSTVAPDALILTSAEKHGDFSLASLSLPGGGNGGKGDRACRGSRGSQEIKPGCLRHRRDWKELDEKGYRRFAVYRLLEPDGHMQTLGFGVTKRAALPNTAAVCGRSTFHSEQRCMEQLCRQRTAKDYAYVSANDEHRGPSDPGSYSVSCKHERMSALLRTGLERYNAEMARVAVERERQAKDAALQAKVEIGKAQLANRRAKEDAAARSLARKTDAKHLKVSAAADRSRHKWELRMLDSQILEARGSWEKRQDLGGSIFYCCVSEEGLPEPFSWDPPECWDATDPSAWASQGAAAAEGSSVGDGRSAPGAGVGGVDTDGPLTDQLSGDLPLLGLDADQERGHSQGNDSLDQHHNETVTPRPLTEEERLSLAVSRLAGNEKLLEALAWRLGIPLADVRPDGREPPLQRARGEDEEELEENREQVELGEHDDASDSEGERGDTVGPPGPLPQDHADLRRIRVAERKRKAQVENGYGHKQPKQSNVPRLALAEAVSEGNCGADSLQGQVGGLGWRRLARANLGQKFLEKVVNPRTQGPTPGTVNTRPKPRPTSTTDPSKATKRAENWAIPVEPMFIADVVAEHARVLHEAERRMKREEVLDDSSSGPFNAAMFAANGPQEFTSVEMRLMALAENDGRSKEEVEEEENRAKAVIAAKTGNLSDLEGLLYDNVPPDTRDSNGNSLLLLAAQQGNKRILKFLLRKGATMNLQNMDGNTVLHFCYSQGRKDLADYLKDKGADDSLLNSEGLTCYEGLQAERLALA